MNRNSFFACLLTIFFLVGLTACGGGSSGSNISGNANFLNGPTKTTGRSTPGRLTNGNYYVTPDKVQYTVTGIDFIKSDGTETAISSLAGCTVTYDRAAASLSKQLSCPFTVPAGTYIGFKIIVNTSYNVLVYDTTNGIYSNSTTNLLTTTNPGAPGQYMVVTANGGGSTNTIATYFPATYTVSASSPPAIQIVFDATHMLSTVLSGTTFSAPVFTQGPPLIGSVSAVSKAEFYSNLPSATALTTPFANTPSFQSASVQIFYSSAGNPSSAQFTYGPQILCMAGCASSCAAGPGTSIATGAWNGNQKDFPGRTGTAPYYGIGGYLGEDSSNNISWAFPTDFTFSKWAAVLSMKEATSFGGTTTLNFACTSTDPGPATGNFSSGKPAFTNTGTTTLTLVAD